MTLGAQGNVLHCMKKRMFHNKFLRTYFFIDILSRYGTVQLPFFICIGKAITTKVD